LSQESLDHNFPTQVVVMIFEEARLAFNPNLLS